MMVANVVIIYVFIEDFEATTTPALGQTSSQRPVRQLPKKYSMKDGSGLCVFLI